MVNDVHSDLFAGLGPRGIIATMVILFLLGWARLVILLLPFRWLAVFLGISRRNVQFTPLVVQCQRQQARKLGVLIRRVAEWTPWQSKCLVQAVVATLFLRLLRIPYVLHLGVAKDDRKGLRAHAWIKAGSCAVTGGEGVPEFTVVSTFLSPLLIELDLTLAGD